MRTMGPYLERLYWQAMFRAEFYLWSAIRGFADTGNDPILGRDKGKLRHNDPIYIEEGREVNKALARVWMRRAVHIRMER